MGLIACVLGSVSHIIAFVLYTVAVFVTSYFVCRNNPKLVSEVTSVLSADLKAAEAEIAKLKSQVVALAAKVGITL